MLGAGAVQRPEENPDDGCKVDADLHEIRYSVAEIHYARHSRKDKYSSILSTVLLTNVQQFISGKLAFHDRLRSASVEGLASASLVEWFSAKNLRDLVMNFDGSVPPLAAVLLFNKFIE